MTASNKTNEVDGAPRKRSARSATAVEVALETLLLRAKLWAVRYENKALARSNEQKGKAT